MVAVFQVGRLLCRPVRDFLGQARLRGYIEEWHEGAGWVSRTFTVRGSEQGLKVVMDSLRRAYDD